MDCNEWALAGPQLRDQSQIKSAIQFLGFRGGLHDAAYRFGFGLRVFGAEVVCHRLSAESRYALFRLETETVRDSFCECSAFLRHGGLSSVEYFFASYEEPRHRESSSQGKGAEAALWPLVHAGGAECC